MRTGHLNKRFAFTIVELLVVLAIIGILAALLLPTVLQAREGARKTTCQSQLRQMASACLSYETKYRQLPSGWIGDESNEDLPGWGWAARVLPDLGELVTYNQIQWEYAVDATENIQLRDVRFAIMRCASDTGPNVFLLGEGDGHEHHSADEDEEHEHGGNVDLGPTLFRAGKSNYVGNFGTTELEEGEYAGNGIFFGNSRLQSSQIRDGMSNTILLGERSSLYGGSLWHGVVHEAAAHAARVVGVVDHAPNDKHGHFDDFRSFHAGGVNFAFGDMSTHFLSESVDPAIYQALATRVGRESVPSFKGD